MRGDNYNPSRRGSYHPCTDYERTSNIGPKSLGRGTTPDDVRNKQQDLMQPVTQQIKLR